MRDAPRGDERAHDDAPARRDAGADARAQPDSGDATLEARAPADGGEGGGTVTKDAGSDATKPVDAGTDVDDARCAIVAEGDAGGMLAWGENFGIAGFTTPAAIAVDPTSGDVVTAGSFDGTVTFGGTIYTSHGEAGAGYDTFVAKFDASGALVWSQDFGNGSLTGAKSVAVDSAGNIAIGGTFQGTLSFGGLPLTAVGTADIFVAELDASGAYLWSKSFGVAGQAEELDSVGVDSSGNVFLGGVAVGGVDFGQGPATGLYVAKLSPAGAPVWSTAFDTSCESSSPTLAVDPHGDVVLAGCFVGTVDFGGGDFTSKSGGDAFVAKYDSSGMFQWANHYGAIIGSGASGSDVAPGGLAVGPCGALFLLGTFGAAGGPTSIDFGTGSLTSGADTVFLAALDPAGNTVWAKAFDSATENSLFPGSLAADGAGGVTLSSGLAGTVDYGTGPLTSPSTTTPTLSFASFDATGAPRWAYAETSSSTATASNVAVPGGLAARGDTLYVSGSFGSCSADCDDGMSVMGTTLMLPGRTLNGVSAGDMFLANFTP